MRRKLIRELVFETYCEFIWNCQLEDLYKYVWKKYRYEINIDGATGKFIVVETREEVIGLIIWVSNKEELVHEISHLVFELMRIKGIPINKDTEEVFTHLHNYYLQSIKRIIK